jgi:hypothetical protein
MAKNKRTRNTGAGTAKNSQPFREPGHYDVMRNPHIIGVASMRMHGNVFVQIAHPDYTPNQIIALVRQGEIDLEPIAPGEVGTLILNGFPYTVVGYYAFSVVDAECEAAPEKWLRARGRRGKHTSRKARASRRKATHSATVRSTGRKT